MNVLQSRRFGSKLIGYLKDPRVRTWRKLAGVAALAYVVLPIDAVPDFIPIFGWLDDVGVFGAAAAFVMREVNRHEPVVDVDSKAR